VAQTALPGKKTGAEARVADAIAEDVAQALSADMGTVVAYRRMDGVAVLIGFYFADPKMSGQAREYLEARFYKIAGEPVERSRSMSYRVMQTGESEACFLLDHRTGTAIPPDSTMLSFPDGLPQIVSQNSAPINVFGRPWGVINVGGLRPFQFSSSAATTLSDLASFYSSFIFYHWLLANIDGMNSLTVDPKLSRGAKYAGLCAHVCNLLLADSASIWSAHVEEEDRFDLVAWTNRPDLDSTLAERSLDRKTAVDDFYSETSEIQSSWPFHFDLAKADRCSGAAEVARAQQVWIQGTLHQGLFSKDWFDKEHTRGLAGGEFKTICIVPVRAAGTLRGFITLLNKSSRCYEEHWREVMRIISEEVGLMIQSIEIQATLQQNLFRPLRHEVRPAVNGLRERIAKLDRLARKIEFKDDNLDRDFHLVQSDIVRTADELERRLGALLDQGQTRNPSSTEDVILEDAKLRAARHKGTTQDLHAH
jgi:GAF domain-containing protein